MQRWREHAAHLRLCVSYSLSLNIVFAQPPESPQIVTSAGTFSGDQMNDYSGSVLNGVDMQAEYQANQGGSSGKYYATEAVTGALAVPASGTKHQYNAVAGYVRNGSMQAGTNSVGVYGQGRSTVNKAWTWGINSIVSDARGTAGNILTSFEADANIYGSPGVVTGIAVAGLGAVFPGSSYAIHVLRPSGAKVPWGFGLQFDNGATNGPALEIGAVCTAGTCDSQRIDLNANIDGRWQTTRLSATPSGLAVSGELTVTGAQSFKSAAGPADAGLSRTGSATLAVGNGTEGDASGTLTYYQHLGPASAPSGRCGLSGAWVFSQDGHATFCDHGTWVTKI